MSDAGITSDGNLIVIAVDRGAAEYVLTVFWICVATMAAIAILLCVAAWLIQRFSSPKEPPSWPR